MLKIVKRCLADESGATAIEYGLIASLISVMVITGASALGGSVSEKFSDISDLISGPAEPAIMGSPPA